MRSNKRREAGLNLQLSSDVAYRDSRRNKRRRKKETTYPVELIYTHEVAERSSTVYADGLGEGVRESERRMDEERVREGREGGSLSLYPQSWPRAGAVFHGHCCR